MRSIFALAVACCTLLFASTALADPCKAIPDAGPTPAWLKPGSKFEGPVVYVGDGDSLCVGVGRSPSTWVEVRLADFYAPELNEAGGQEAKAGLIRLVMNRSVSCVAGKRSYDRVVATCALNRTSVGVLMRGLGLREGGRGHKP